MQLIEEAVEGCWVGFRARVAHQAASGTDIGTVYSPPSKLDDHQHVETVVDISLRREVRVCSTYSDPCSNKTGLECCSGERWYPTSADESHWKLVEIHICATFLGALEIKLILDIEWFHTCDPSRGSSSSHHFIGMYTCRDCCD